MYTGRIFEIWEVMDIFMLPTNMATEINKISEENAKDEKLING